MRPVAAKAIASNVSPSASTRALPKMAISHGASSPERMPPCARGGAKAARRSPSDCGPSRRRARRERW
eukprot:6553358-Prymnesium_polylepis.2